MEQIYILRLRAGKYYIGKTRNIEKRYEVHLNGEGSAWTKKYSPLSLVKTIKSTSQFDEDKYVKEYMAKYGIENVRGGTYSNVVLDANCIAVLEKEIRHSKNLCTRCGRDTHYIKDCYATTDSNGAVIGECEVKKDDVKKPNVYKENMKTKTKKKGWGGDDSSDDGDSFGSSEDCEDCEDCEDETIQVLMNMTSGMLKKAAKGRYIYS
jgi:predicted GIY-YIG superfamily endonuclease